MRALERKYGGALPDGPRGGGVRAGLAAQQGWAILDR